MNNKIIIRNSNGTFKTIIYNHPPDLQCICQNCDKEFVVKGCDLKWHKGKFCSRKCYNEYNKKLYASNRIIITCAFCCKASSKTLYIFKQSSLHFCNKDCRKKYMIGNKNPNWKNGVSFKPYPSNWSNSLKEKIRKRDNYKCQLCGCNEIENNKKLDIHHIDYNKKNLDMNNLISLCKNCHIQITYSKSKDRKEYWKIILTDIMNSKVLAIVATE